MNVELRSNDILAGRGKGVASHSGNVIFREIIDRHYVEYHGTKSNKSKRNVTQKVQAEIANLRPAGRFLIKKRDTYFVLNSTEVESKIKQAMRDRIKLFARGKEVMKPKETSQYLNPNEQNLGSSGNRNGQTLPPNISQPNEGTLDSSWNESKKASSSITFDLDKIKMHPSVRSYSSKMEMSDMSLDSFISQALSSLSLKSIPVENLNASSALINPMSLDDLFLSNENMMDGFEGVLRNNGKMFPRQKEMLLKRELENVSTNRTTNFWPSSIPIENTSSIMMPNDLDLSNYNYDSVGSSMSSFHKINMV